MQQLIQFLRKVLPDTGKYAAVIIGDYTKQTPCDTLEDLASIVLAGSSHGANAYFGLSSYTRGEHQQTRPDGSTKTVFRTQQNAQYQKAFWLDLDVGAGDKKYPTQRDAVVDLLRFLNTTGLPEPTLVSSGYGIHVYWPLSECLKTDVWLRVAAYLDALTKVLGLKADTSATMDAARILRPIQTINYKSGQCRPVELLVDSPIYGSVDFVKKLLDYAQTNNIVPTQKALSTGLVSIASPAISPIMIQAMGGHVPGNIVPTKDPVPIVKGCRQIFESGQLTYDIWFGMMDVMKYCHNGRQITHTLSNRDARYDYGMCDSKYNNAIERDNGPTLCSTFARHNPKGCEGCPYVGTISSPAELGIIKTKPAETQAITVEESERVYDIPVFKHPYFQMDESGMWEMVEEDNGTRRRVKICDYSFRILYRQTRNISKHEREVKFEVEISDALTKNKTYAKAGAKDLLGRDGLQVWWFNNKVVFGNETMAKKAGYIMRAYLEQIRASIKDIEVHDHIGWVELKSGADKERGFIVNETLYAENTPPTQIDYATEHERFFNERYQQKGNMRAWRQAVDFYRYKGGEPALFAVAAAFGSPLMEFMPSGSQAGMINFWSPESGLGKTTILRVVNTVWGCEDNLVPKNSTYNSLYKTMGMFKNLPVCIDEMTNYDGKQLSHFIYNVSEGSEKLKLDSELRVRANGKWKLITFSTANTAVQQRMQSYLMQRDAEIKRVFEVQIGKSFIAPTDAFDNAKIWSNNYGLAGPLMMERLLEDKERLANLASEAQDLVRQFTKSSSERYWAVVAAAAVLGARLAKDYGVIDLDENVIRKFAENVMSEMRSSLIGETTDGAAHFADFLLENVRSTLVVESHLRRRETNIMEGIDPYIKRMPTGDLNIRIEEEEKIIVVRIAALREWVKRKNGDLKHMLDELGRKGIWDWQAGKRKIKLSSQVSSLPDASADCYLFRLVDNLDILTGEKVENERELYT